jgi:hypothetical protein
VEAVTNRFSSLPRKKAIAPGVIALSESMEPSGVLRPVFSSDAFRPPKVLPVSPSHLHPRIALTRPGGARVKVGGPVPLAEPEPSLLCFETMRKRQGT